jgi:hypothetical protein
MITSRSTELIKGFKEQRTPIIIKSLFYILKPFINGRAVSG